MTTPYIDAPERCEECERLLANIGIYGADETNPTDDIFFMELDDHRSVCRVWLAAHE